MFLLKFSLDNLSLMALTVATGFVVDDAIVVLENVTRHVEAGMGRFEAALLGAREVGFTASSISISLVAVFIPILLWRRHRRTAVSRVRRHPLGGDPGLLADLLTTTPMMCAYLIDPPNRPPGRLARIS